MENIIETIDKMRRTIPLLESESEYAMWISAELNTRLVGIQCPIKEVDNSTLDEISNLIWRVEGALARGQKELSRMKGFEAEIWWELNEPTQEPTAPQACD